MQSGIWNQHLSAQTLHLRNGVSVRILVPWMHTPHTRTCRLANLGMGMGSLCIHLELGAQGWALGPDSLASALAASSWSVLARCVGAMTQ